MTRGRRTVCTIGHSNHAIDALLAMLERYGVTALADVRSAPYSRFNPQFNKEALEQRSRTRGIEYVFLGRELGARSSDPSCYEHGRVRYARLACTPMFRAGIERVVRDERQLALMCAEKEPLECHRTLLVARALTDLGLTVQHILADGRLESHEAAMERLLGVVGLPQQELFRSRSELIEEALARQELRITHVAGVRSAQAHRDASSREGAERAAVEHATRNRLYSSDAEE